MHILDNPAWHALATNHRGLAVRATEARGPRLGGVIGSDLGGELARYPRDVAPFLAIAAAGPVDEDALASLVAAGDQVFLIGPAPAVSAAWRLDHLGSIVQMVCDAPIAELDGPTIAVLGDADRPAVLALTALVYPHYFRPRTMELGRYLGIFDGDRLAAIAGERMSMPGLGELSAICAHPDFAGRGLARRILARATNDLFARGVAPFLHVSPDNHRARELYERNGYRTRTAIAFSSLRRA